MTKTIEVIDLTEIDSISGGPLPALVVLAAKAFMTGASVAAVYLAAEDLADTPGHNHYGK